MVGCQTGDFTTEETGNTDIVAPKYSKTGAVWGAGPGVVGARGKIRRPHPAMSSLSDIGSA